MPVRLPDVSLCACDFVALPLTHRALQASMQQCAFGDAMLLTDRPMAGDYRTVPVEPVASVSDYSHFMLKRLAPYVRTSHVLVVQWDGYVVDAGAWSNEFLEFDYIGAMWPQYGDGLQVGNGGFSLRSHKLLKALQDPRFASIPGENEDALICRRYRRLLEIEFGIRFAPISIAERFSYENALPLRATFGFHGVRNMPRHVSAGELLGLIELIPAHAYQTPHGVALAYDLFTLGKIGPLGALYRKIRAHADRAAIIRAFTALAGNRAAAAAFVTACDRMLLDGTPPTWLTRGKVALRNMRPANPGPYRARIIGRLLARCRLSHD